jgi:uncharacterized RDD family membrane protein YckC
LRPGPPLPISGVDPNEEPRCPPPPPQAPSPACPTPTSTGASTPACPCAAGFVIAAVGFLYRTSLLAGPASATLGMRFTGIEFRRGNGERFDFMTAFLHTAIYAVCIGTFVLQLLSCLTIVGTRYRQSIADLILGTTAIKRPAD